MSVLQPRCPTCGSEGPLATDTTCASCEDGLVPARTTPAYVHPQGVAPDGIWFDGNMATELLAQGVIDHCTDCEDRYPDEPTYAIVGADDDEDEQHAAIVRRYEVPAP